jgi:hypothetical protein
LAEGRRTTSLGHLLAPMAIRYIVVPSRNAPVDAHSSPVPTPVVLLSGLSQQVDLRTVPTDASLTVYENAAWAPARAILSARAADASRSGTPAASQSASLGGAEPVLLAGSFNHFTGRVPASADVLVSSTASSHWRMSVEGHAAARRPAFGWAMAFAVPNQGGKASLGFATPVGRTLVILLETALWLVAVGLVIADRRRPPVSPDEGDLSVPRGWLEDAGRDDVSIGSSRRRWVAEPVGVDSDEVWA